MQLTNIDLFAGIGGFALGFQRAGIKSIAHVEIDIRCQNILQRHFESDLVLSDVRQCGKNNLPNADIITFGSPCQDLSVAGKREGIQGNEVDSSLKQLELFENSSQELPSGRMFPVLYRAIKDRISGKSSRRSSIKMFQCLDLEDGQSREWLEADKQNWRGGYLMPNISVSPSDVRVCSLWSILEEDVPQRYYLSAKAARGILRRADRRGKSLPPSLQAALEQAAQETSEPKQR